MKLNCINYFRCALELVECWFPKPDVVGSSPSAPVIMYNMRKVDFTRFSSGINLFLLCGFWKDTAVVIMYLCLFSTVFTCYGDNSTSGGHQASDYIEL